MNLKKRIDNWISFPFSKSSCPWRLALPLPFPSPFDIVLFKFPLLNRQCHPYQLCISDLFQISNPSHRAIACDNIFFFLLRVYDPWQRRLVLVVEVGLARDRLVHVDLIKGDGLRIAGGLLPGKHRHRRARTLMVHQPVKRLGVTVHHRILQTVLVPDSVTQFAQLQGVQVLF